MSLLTYKFECRKCGHKETHFSGGGFDSDKSCEAFICPDCKTLHTVEADAGCRIIAFCPDCGKEMKPWCEASPIHPHCPKCGDTFTLVAHWDDF